MKPEDIKNALDYTRKGFHVFPSIYKKGQHIGLCKWGAESSNDPNKIKAWGSLHPDTAYFCIALKQSSLTVIDVDVKDERRGEQTLEDLTLIHGDLPPTIMVRTPSGGKHYFFGGNAKFGADRLGPGIDIPVMVPLPGSNVPGKGLYKLVNNSNIAPLPEWVTKIAGEVADKPSLNPQDPLIELDQPQNITLAINYLNNTAQEAPVGRRDNTCYNVATHIRQDFALSQDTCEKLMVEHYLYKCEGDWTAKHIKAKVESAYKYAQSPPGKDTAVTEFELIEIKPQNKGKVGFKNYLFLTKNLDQPNWLVKNYLEMDSVTLFYGETGAYKSFLAIDMGLHITANEDWIGQKTKQGTVFYLAGEGHGGIKRRLSAWGVCRKQKGSDLPFHVSDHAVHLDKKGNVKELIQSIRDEDPKPALIIIDTLATAFGSGNENATQDMNRFLNYVNEIRSQLKCSIIIVHHTGHQETNRPRGAYALMAGVDAYYHIESKEKGLTCLRSAGKMKDGIPQPDTWFKTVQVELGVDEDLETITSLVMEHLPDYVEPVKEKKLGIHEAPLLSIIQETGQIDKESARVKFKEVKGEKYDRRSFSNAINKLVDKGRINQLGETLTIIKGLEE